MKTKEISAILAAVTLFTGCIFTARADGTSTGGDVSVGEYLYMGKIYDTDILR